MRYKKYASLFILLLILFQGALLLSADIKIKNIEYQIQKEEEILSSDAIVQIEIEAFIADGDSILLKGSGAIIGVYNEKSYVLTADHICTPHFPVFIANEILETRFYINDYTGETHDARAIYNNPDVDLCLVAFDGEIDDVVPLKIAEESSYLNERVYNFAAPVGFYAPYTVLLFEGFYAGDIIDEGYPASVYTIPAAGGSSGSAIINRKGEIVGMLHSTMQNFHHISIATRQQEIKEFIEEWEILGNVVF